MQLLLLYSEIEKQTEGEKPTQAPSVPHMLGEMGGEIYFLSITTRFSLLSAILYI